MYQLFESKRGNLKYGFVGSLDSNGKFTDWNKTDPIFISFGAMHNMRIQISWCDNVYTFQNLKKSPRPRRDENRRFIQYACIEYDTISEPITYTSITPEQAFDIVQELVQKYDM